MPSALMMDMYPIVRDLTELDFVTTTNSNHNHNDVAKAPSFFTTSSFTAAAAAATWCCCNPSYGGSPPLVEERKEDGTNRGSIRRTTHPNSSGVGHFCTAKTTATTASAGSKESTNDTATAVQLRRFEDDYVLTRQIVRGTTSTVWECIHRMSGNNLCVKMIDKRRFVSQEDVETALREVAMYRTINNSIPCLPYLRDVVGEDTTHLYIVQELLHGGGNNNNNLGRLLLNEGGPLDERRVRDLARGLVQAVAELHSRHIAHNDLHPDNVLLRDVVAGNGNGNGSLRHIIKLCDLGRATYVDGNGENFESCRRHQTGPGRGTRHSSLYYTAPEVIQGRPGGFASDMWSVGIILLYCLAGHLPFEGGGGAAGCPPGKGSLECQFCWAQRRPFGFPTTHPRWSGTAASRGAKQVVVGLLHPDPAVRMTCDDALAHPWLATTSPPASTRQQIQQQQQQPSSGPQLQQQKPPLLPRFFQRREASSVGTDRPPVAAPSHFGDAHHQPPPFLLLLPSRLVVGRRHDPRMMGSVDSSRKPNKSLVRRVWERILIRPRLAIGGGNDLSTAGSTLSSSLSSSAGRGAAAA